MDRKELTSYINKKYQVLPDYPWAKYPDYQIFRHKDSGKWFCLAAQIPGDKLGKADAEPIDVINVKADPEFIRFVAGDHGFYPAYHMSKKHWITVVLSEVGDKEIRTAIDTSFEMTKK